MQKTKMIQDVAPIDRWLPDNCKPCRAGPRFASPKASCRECKTSQPDSIKTVNSLAVFGFVS
jgi:hypothetical protein